MAFDGWSGYWSLYWLLIPKYNTVNIKLPSQLLFLPLSSLKNVRDVFAQLAPEYAVKLA